MLRRPKVLRRPLQVGMTTKEAEVRRRQIAGDTRREWVVRGEWRSQFAKHVERMVHAQLRCRRRLGPHARLLGSGCEPPAEAA